MPALRDRKTRASKDTERQARSRILFARPARIPWRRPCDSAPLHNALPPSGNRVEVWHFVPPWPSAGGSLRRTGRTAPGATPEALAPLALAGLEDERSPGEQPQTLVPWRG